jgi:hypothetical protein
VGVEGGDWDGRVEVGVEVGDCGAVEVGVDVGDWDGRVEVGVEVGDCGAVEVGVDVGEGELPCGGAAAPGWVKVIVQLPNPSPSTPRVSLTLAAPGALVGFRGLRDLYAVPEA